MATAARLVVEVSAIDKRFTSTLKGAEATVGRFARRMEGIGRSIAAGFALPAGIIAAGVFKAFGDFDKAVTQGLARVDDITEDLRGKVEKAAMALSEELPVSAAEGAKAFGELAAAGLSAEASLVNLPVVAKFAAAGQIALAESTQFLVGSVTALGNSTDDMERVGDVLVKAANISTGSVRDLSEALTNDAGQALRLFNKDAEEGVAVLAAYAQQNIKGAEAGQKLYQLLRDLSSKAILNREAFKEAGISVFDTAGQMRNLADIIGDLERHLAGLSTEEKRSAITRLGLAEKSLQATLALVGMSRQIRETERELRNAGGTTDRVANFQIANLNDRLAILKNRLVNAAIGIGSELAPSLGVLLDPLDSGINGLKNFGTFLGQLSPLMKDLIVGFGGGGVALSALVIALGLGARAVQALIVLFKELGLLLIRHPILLIATGVTALGVSLIATTKRTALTRAEIEKLGAASGTAAGRLAELTREMEKSEEQGEQLRKKIQSLQELTTEKRTPGKRPSFDPLGGAMENLLESSKRDLKNQMAELADLQSAAGPVRIVESYTRFAAAMKKAGEAARVHGDELQFVQSVLAVYETLLLDLAPLMSDEDSRWKSLKLQMGAYKKVLEDVTKKREADVSGARGQTDRIRELAMAMEDLRLKQMLGADQGEILNERYRLLQDTLFETARAMRDNGASSEEITLGTQSIRAELEAVRNELMLGSSSWFAWGAAMSQTLQSTQALVVSFGELTFTAFQGLADGIGNSLAQALVFGESFQKSFKDMAKQVAANFIASLVSMAVQLVAFSVISKLVGDRFFNSLIGRKAGEAYAGAYASVMQSVPFPLNVFLAPIVAGASATGLQAGARGFAVAGLETGGMTMGEGFAYLHPREVITPIDRVWDMAGMQSQDRDIHAYLQVDGITLATALLKDLPRAARRKFGGSI